MTAKHYKIAISALGNRTEPLAISFARGRRGFFRPEAIPKHFSDNCIMDALMIVP